MSTDDPRLLCSCLRKYVSNSARCNKWALNDFESWRSRVAVEEFFPDEVCRVTIQNYFVLAFVLIETRKANGRPCPAMRRKKQTSGLLLERGGLL